MPREPLFVPYIYSSESSPRQEVALSTTERLNMMIMGQTTSEGIPERQISALPRAQGPRRSDYTVDHIEL